MAEDKTPQIDPAGAAAGFATGALGMAAVQLDGILAGLGKLEDVVAGNLTNFVMVGDQTFDVWLKGIRDSLQITRDGVTEAADAVAEGSPKVG